MKVLHQLLNYRYSGLLFFLIILILGIDCENIKANVVGIKNPSGGRNIQTFDETNWTPVTPEIPLTMSGHSDIKGYALTWNSNNLLFYIIIQDITLAKIYLSTVDPNTGVCNLVGEMGGSDPFYSLTFSSSTNLLYTLKISDTVYGKVSLYGVDPNNGTATRIGGPYFTNNPDEKTGVIAYNYDDGYIYHWQNGNVFPFFNPTVIEKIDLTTFAVSQTYSGYAYGVISGIVYKGGGTFIATEYDYREPTYGVNLTSTGGITDVGIASPLAGLGYIDPLLPVELASFTSSVNENNVTLNWSTASETNNSGFDIERAINTIENGQLMIDSWSKIGNVNGNGTINEPKEYSFTDRNLASGYYSYRLKQIDYNGNFEYFNLSNEVNIGVPSQFELSQNYPNPFNPTTNLEFGISELGFVSLKVYNTSGKEVATLVNEIKPAGYYTVNFKASGLTSGIYFYTLNSNNFSITKIMLFIK